jgi:flagella basal body P-ring formation protein FlgA
MIYAFREQITASKPIRSKRSIRPLDLRLKIASLLSVILLVNFLPALGFSEDFRTDSLEARQVKIILHRNAEVATNLVRLKDVATVEAGGDQQEEIANLLVGPSPLSGKSVQIELEQVRTLMALRGIDLDSIQFSGATTCLLHRDSPETRKVSGNNVATAAVSSSIPDSVTQANHLADQQTASKVSPASTLIQGLVSPQVTAAAKRNVTEAIINHLDALSGDGAGYEIDADIDPKHAKVLSQRLRILRIGGGESPWTGRQRFEVIVNDGSIEGTAIPIEANITLPPEVFATVGPLNKGHIVAETDLKPIRLRKDSRIHQEECFEDLSKLVGQELRRAVSTGQPVQQKDVGPPRVIMANDVVSVQVIAGEIIAKTSGRALQSGSQDDVIHIEITGAKKRIVARVIGPGCVEAIASYNGLR